MKKNIISRFAIVVLAAGSVSGCTYKTGSGDIATETRTIASFNGVSVSGNFNVEIRTGEKQEVVIEADDNLIKNIKTEVVNGTLRIKTTDRNLRNAHFNVHISVPSIDNLSASAAANIEVKNTLNSEKAVTFKASSAANITADIKSPEVTADASSAAEIKLTGHTRNFTATTSSAATIKAIDLLAENTVISSSSGASAHVHASVSLDATASSGADITYRGGANVKKSISSGGEVKAD